ncbi:conserved domain protein [delta proteobacterium NaphS2]|nr:conserved domain protein [delta proteobacterium NaphS2]
MVKKGCRVHIQRYSLKQEVQSKADVFGCMSPHGKPPPGWDKALSI